MYSKTNRHNRQNSNLSEQSASTYCRRTMEFYKYYHLHKDLKISTVKEEINRFVTKHERRLHAHDNIKVLHTLLNTGLKLGLKIIKLIEFV